MRYDNMWHITFVILSKWFHFHCLFSSNGFRQYLSITLFLRYCLHSMREVLSFVLFLLSITLFLRYYLHSMREVLSFVLLLCLPLRENVPNISILLFIFWNGEYFFFFTSTKQAIYFLFLHSFCFYFMNLYWVDLFEYICIYSLKVTLDVYQKGLFYQKRSLGSQTVILCTIKLVYDRGIERYLWQIGESYVTLYLIYLSSLWRLFLLLLLCLVKDIHNTKSFSHVRDNSRKQAWCIGHNH